MSTVNTNGPGTHALHLFPRSTDPDSGWVLQHELLTRITAEVAEAGWGIGAEEVELVLLAAENFLAETAAPVTGHELNLAREQAAAWFLVAAGNASDAQALYAALDRVRHWCENPTNRSQHTLRQQCALLDHLRDQVVAVLEKIPVEPRMPQAKVSLLTDTEFRALLDLHMCSDPWPIPGAVGAATHDVLEELLNREALRRGFPGWVDAYHSFVAPVEGGA